MERNITLTITLNEKGEMSVNAERIADPFGVIQILTKAIDTVVENIAEEDTESDKNAVSDVPNEHTEEPQEENVSDVQ